MPLKPNDAERFYKELAEHYMEREGEQYRQELMQQPAILTPRLDSLMRTRLHRKNTVRWVSGAAAAAAALLLVVGLLPRLLRGFDNPPPADSASSPASAADTLLPLNFTLPDNLRVASSEWDNGQSIYTLRDTARDDVVLMMEPDGTFAVPDGFSPLSIDGSTAYARRTRDYNLLTFSAGGITYTLSCRYELDTLIALGRQIL